MKIGLVGYQGSGKSTVFELLTGIAPDLSKAHTGQVGVADVPDERFRRLVELFSPKKSTPARIELFDTPGLTRDQSGNAQRLGVIREAAALIHVVGAFAGDDPEASIQAFEDDLILADLQVVENRVNRLEKDATKPRPDREELLAELEVLRPVHAELVAGRSLRDAEWDAQQLDATRAFSLLTRKPFLILLNTAEPPNEGIETTVAGVPAVAAAAGLELELQALSEPDRSEFAEEMGFTESSREALLRAMFRVTDLISFFTCDEKEVRQWLLRRGATAVEAADTIHSDLARGFIRAEIMATSDLLELGSEREVKAAGKHHVEGKEYIVQDGDEIVVRFNV